MTESIYPSQIQPEPGCLRFQLYETTPRQVSPGPLTFDGEPLVAETEVTARRYVKARGWYWQKVMNCRVNFSDDGLGFDAHSVNGVGAVVGSVRVREVQTA